MRIALLGNTATHADSLGRQLPFAHEFVSAGSLSNARADVVVALRFTKDEAQRFSPRLLHSPGAGVDAIDFDALPADCAVCNVFEHEGPIAEYAFAAMLEWETGFAAAAAAFSNETWSEAYRTRKPHGELAGKTIGLVGYGHIGAAIARRAAAFDMRVIAVASRSRPAEPGVAWIGGPDRLGELLAQADYVLVACPLNDQTRGMMGAPQLAAMKPTAVAINVARGEVFDEAALYEALRERRIAGAVLDAWFRYPGPGETVPPSRFAFDTLPNVTCTPHIAAWTAGLWERRFTVIADNIRRFHDGAPLRNLVRAPLTPEIAPDSMERA